MNRNLILEDYQQSRARPVRLPKVPDASDTMRELQEIARTHPDLADAMQRAVWLISRQSAYVHDIYRGLIASRLVEDMK